MNTDDRAAVSGEISLSIPGRGSGDLACALGEEEALIRTLIAVLERQRRAVAEHDLDGVEETISNSQRILLTLGEARKRRRTLVGILAGGADGDLPVGAPLDSGDLEVRLGGRLGPQASAAWERLKTTAQELSGALLVNQKILEDAIRFGEEHVRTLYGSALPDGAAYTAEARPSNEGGGGVLINRKV